MGSVLKGLSVYKSCFLEEMKWQDQLEGHRLILQDLCDERGLSFVTKHKWRGTRTHQKYRSLTCWVLIDFKTVNHTYCIKEGTHTRTHTQTHTAPVLLRFLFLSHVQIWRKKIQYTVWSQSTFPFLPHSIPPSLLHPTSHPRPDMTLYV